MDNTEPKDNNFVGGGFICNFSQAGVLPKKRAINVTRNKSIYKN